MIKIGDKLFIVSKYGDIELGEVVKVNPHSFKYKKLEPYSLNYHFMVRNSELDVAGSHDMKTFEPIRVSGYLRDLMSARNAEQRDFENRIAAAFQKLNNLVNNND